MITNSWSRCRMAMITTANRKSRNNEGVRRAVHQSQHGLVRRPVCRILKPMWKDYVVCTSDNCKLCINVLTCFFSMMSNIQVGAKFSDWNSFSDALKQYSEQNCVTFVKCNTKSVEAADKLRTNKLPDRLKYCSAKFVCYNYGEKHVQKNRQTDGTRPHQR